MTTLIAENGVNIHQVLTPGKPAVVKPLMPPCVIGPMYQIAKDEPLTASDLNIYESTTGAFNAVTSEIIDANLNTINFLDTTFKVVITAPSYLAGSYNIQALNLVDGTLKIFSPAHLPVQGADTVSYYVHAASKEYVGRGVVSKYPGLIVNATDSTKSSLISEPSVAVKIKDINGFHTVNKAAIMKSFTDLLYTSVTKKLGPADFTVAEVGQYVYITAPSTMVGFYKITAKTNPVDPEDMELTLVADNGTTPADATGVDGMVLTPGYMANPTNFMMTPGIAYKGQILVSYSALRRDKLYEFIAFQDIEDIQTQIGPTNTPSNPLGYGAGYLVKNTRQSIQCYAVAIAGNNSDEYAKAIDYLNRKKQAYYILPLSNEMNIVNMCAQHVLQVSRPEERWFANGVFNLPIAMYNAIRTAGSTGDFTGSPLDPSLVFFSGTGNVQQFHDTLPGTDLEILGVETGHFFKATMVLNDTIYTVEAPILIDETHALTRNTFYADFGAASAKLGDLTIPVNGLIDAEILKYEIISEYFSTDSTSDRARQAQVTAANIRSLSVNFASASDEQTSKRIIVIEPDYLETDQGHIVPGYYLAAMVVGTKAVVPVDMPISEYPIVGVKRLIHSTEYFDNIHIRTIESAGCGFAYQPNEGSAARLRHQLTTDLTNEKTMEWSSVTALDSFSIRISKGVCTFIGRNKINSNTLLNVRLYLQAYFTRSISIGEISSAQILELKENPESPGHAIIRIRATQDNPFNVADIYIEY